MKNRALHSGIKMCPYKAMFGINPRVGLSTTKLSNDIIPNLHSEEDLDSVFPPIEENETTVEENLNAEEQINEEEENRHELLNCATIGINADAVDDQNGSVAITNTANKIKSVRILAAESLQKQAKRMKRQSDKLHTNANIGDNVTVAIPDVDRARGSLRNIVAVVLDVNDHLYKLGTKDGCLKQLYARSEFEVCKQNFLNVEDVDQTKTLSLRAAATQSSGKAQGYSRCHCQKHCGTNACKCKRQNILCNSKCHNSATCRNK